MRPNRKDDAWNLPAEIAFVDQIGFHRELGQAVLAQHNQYILGVLRNYLDSIKTTRSRWWPGYNEAHRDQLVEHVEDRIRSLGHLRKASSQEAA